MGAGPTSDDGTIGDGTPEPGAVVGPDASRPGRARWQIACGAAVLAVGVGIAAMVAGPMVAGWYLFVAALVVFGWSSAQLLAPRVRTPYLVVGGLAASLGLLAWSPGLGATGSQTWLGWAGLACPYALAFPVALVIGAASKRIVGEARTGALTVTLAGIVLAVLVAQPAALKVRIIAREATFDEVAEELLRSGDGTFEGTTYPTSVSSLIRDPSLADRAPASLDAVPSVAGVEVRFGSVTSDPALVRLCLPGTVEWSCTNELVFAPDEDLDGDRTGWNVDCDLVTRHLAGDWYLRAMECPRN